MAKELSINILDEVSKVEELDEKASRLRGEADIERRKLLFDFRREYGFEGYVRHKKSGVIGRLVPASSGRGFAFFPQKKDGSDSAKRATKYEEYCSVCYGAGSGYLTNVLNAYEPVDYQQSKAE